MKAGRKGDDKGQDGWMAGPYGHEFEQAPGDGEGQGSLACCSLLGHKESDMTEQLIISIKHHWVTEWSQSVVVLVLSIFILI